MLARLLEYRWFFLVTFILGFVLGYLGVFVGIVEWGRERWIRLLVGLYGLLQRYRDWRDRRRERKQHNDVQQ